MGFTRQWQHDTRYVRTYVRTYAGLHAGLYHAFLVCVFLVKPLFSDVCQLTFSKLCRTVQL